MKKILFGIVSLLMFSMTSAEAALPFAVNYISGPSQNGNPVILDMVPNSTQQVRFDITTTIPASPIIKCSVTTAPSSKGSITVGTLGGCANPNGAGLPYPLIFTMTSGSTPGPVNLTLTIQDYSGRNKIDIPLVFNVKSSSARTITFTNYCSFPVWFGIATGTLASKTGADCTSNANCPDGTQCNTTNGQCFWKTSNPAKTAGKDTYKLGAFNGTQPVSNSIQISDYSSTNSAYADGKLWSGGFFGRTGCTFDANNKIHCQTADCGDNGQSDGGCNLGTGAAAPSTQVEPTFLVAKPDSYDVTIINGFNIPMSVTPSLPQGTSNPYDCGVPGGITNVNYKDVLYSTAKPSPTGTLGMCSWTLSPPNGDNRYQWVDGVANPSTCTNDGNCANQGGHCGMSLTSVNNGSGALVCGKLYGYWTDDEICAKNKLFNVNNFLNCTDKNLITPCTGTTGTDCPITVPANTFSLVNLLACTTAPPNAADNKLTFASCFVKDKQISSLNCCGCNNWQDSPTLSGLIPTDSAIVPQCGTKTSTSNTYWTTRVLPNLIWLKTACPSAYTYPYDDKTSGFSCPYAFETGQSAVDYTVTFCPGQKTGGVSPLP